MISNGQICQNRFTVLTAKNSGPT